jgi:NADH:ubiquinone oxidoreductase subunit 6 (subunit J)
MLSTPSPFIKRASTENSTVTGLEQIAIALIAHFLYSFKFASSVFLPCIVGVASLTMLILPPK